MSSSSSSSLQMASAAAAAVAPEPAPEPAAGWEALARRRQAVRDAMGRLRRGSEFVEVSSRGGFAFYGGLPFEVWQFGEDPGEGRLAHTVLAPAVGPPRRERPQLAVSVATTSDDRLAVVGFAFGTAWAVSLETGEVVHRLEGAAEKTPVESVLVSPDDRLAFARNESCVLVWSLETGALLRTLEHDSRVGTLVASPDGRRLLTGSDESGHFLWPGDGDGPREGFPVGGAFTADSRRVISCSSGAANLYSVEDKGLARTFAFPPGCGPASARPLGDGRRVLSEVSQLGKGWRLVVWSLESGAVLQIFDGRAGAQQIEPDAKARVVNVAARGANAMQFSSADAGRVVMHALSGRGRVSVHSVETGEVLLLRGDDQYTCAALSADGKRLVAGEQGCVGVWDVDNAEYKRPVCGLVDYENDAEAEHHPFVFASFSPDGARAVVLDTRGMAHVWTVGPTVESEVASHDPDLPPRRVFRAEAKKVRALPCGRRYGSPSRAAVSPDWKWLAVASQRSSGAGWVTVWPLGDDDDDAAPDAGPAFTFGPFKAVTALSFAPARGLLIADFSGGIYRCAMLKGKPRAASTHGDDDDDDDEKSDGTGVALPFPGGAARGEDDVVFSIACTPVGHGVLAGDPHGVHAWTLNSYDDGEPRYLYRVATDHEPVVALTGQDLYLYDPKRSRLLAAPASFLADPAAMPAWATEMNLDAARDAGDASACAAVLAATVPPRSWALAPSLFVRLAARGDARMLEAAFGAEVEEQPFPRWSAMLHAALDSGSRATVALVARKLVESAQARNRLALVPGEAPRWVLSRPEDDGGVAVALERLVAREPLVARELLDNLPLLASDHDTDIGREPRAALGQSGMLVAPSDEAAPAALWAGAEGDGGTAAVLAEGGRVAFPDLGGADLFDALVDDGGAELFGGATMRAVIEHRWLAFGRAAFLRSAALYLVELAVVVALGLTVQDYERSAGDRLGSGATARDHAVVGLGAALAALELPGLAAALRGLASRGLAWPSFWEMLADARAALAAATVALLAAGSGEAVLLLALLTFAKWLGLLYYLQPFRATGPLVSMVLQIAADMRWFLVILGIAVLGVASALLLLLETEGEADGFDGPGEALFTMFRMLLLGDFDESTLVVGQYSAVVRLLFVLAMVLVPIVLLNLLIALMSDSYERIQERADVEFQKLRARIVQTVAPRNHRDADAYPRHVHVLVPKGALLDPQSAADAGQLWQGVLHSLRAQVLQSEARTIEAMERRMDRRNAEYESLQQKLDLVVAELAAARTRA